jgi:hypothetical protein
VNEKKPVQKPIIQSKTRLIESKVIYNGYLTEKNGPHFLNNKVCLFMWMFCVVVYGPERVHQRLQRGAVGLGWVLLCSWMQCVARDSVVMLCMSSG